MKVTIFHTTNCAFCKTEMQWLDSKNVEYTHYNIEEDELALNELKLLNVGVSVPVTVIKKDGIEDSVIIRGFDRLKLAEHIGI
jgi:glutaredoxin